MESLGSLERAAAGCHQRIIPAGRGKHGACMAWVLPAGRTSALGASALSHAALCSGGGWDWTRFPALPPFCFPG